MKQDNDKVEWPDHEVEFTPEQLEKIELHREAFDGIYDGNLQPLARLLRSDAPLDAGMRLLLSLAITNPEYVGYRVAATGLRPNQKARSVKIAKFKQSVELGVLVERKLAAADKGEYDSTIMDCAASWGVGRTKVVEALALVRKLRAGEFDDFPAPKLRFWVNFALSDPRFGQWP